MPAMRTVPRRSFTSAKAVLGTRSVVMMARGGIVETVGAQAAHQRGRALMILARVEFHADHAGGGGQHLRGRQLAAVCAAALRGGQRHRVARARGAIGVARVHQNGAHHAAASAPGCAG